jgi:hypothetical protein
VKSNLESLNKTFSTSQSVSRWLKPPRLPGKLLSDVVSISVLPALKNSK